MRKLILGLWLLTGCVTEQEDEGIRKFVTSYEVIGERVLNPGTYVSDFDSVYVTFFKDQSFKVDTVAAHSESWLRECAIADSVSAFYESKNK